MTLLVISEAVLMHVHGKADSDLLKYDLPVASVRDAQLILKVILFEILKLFSINAVFGPRL